MTLCLQICGVCWVLAATAEAQSPGNSLEGTWKGTLAGKLRLVLTLTKATDGTYGGILDSVDQGATISCDRVTTDAGKVRLELQRVGGIYEGVLNKDASENAGNVDAGWNGATAVVGKRETNQRREGSN